MARIREFKTNFTAGELDPNVNARTDIKYYYNGAAKLRNVYVLPQGGVRRRDGSTFIDTIPLDGSNSPSNTKLVGFQFSTVQRYLIVFYHNGIKVYKDGVLQATIASTYATEDIRALKFTQSLDTLLIFHPDYAPAQLQRGGSHTSWTLSNWTLNNVPKYTFPDGTYTGTDEEQKLKLIGGGWHSDSTTFTLFVDGVETSNILFNTTGSTTAARIQAALRALPNTSDTGITVSSVSNLEYDVSFGGDDGDQYWGELTWEIKASHAGTEEISVTITTEGDNGGEDVWSATRGWPVCGVFYQGRLYFAGSKELPTTVWGSRAGDFNDFDIGETLDDYGFMFTADTDDVPAFKDIFVGRHLQLFSENGEFYVPKSESEPITPENFSLRRTTFRGIDPNLKPHGVDGATIFVQRGGQALREFIFNDVEQAYQANDISFISSHLIRSPIAMTYRKATSTSDTDYLMLVNDDGTMTVFCTLRTQEINAYTLQATDGDFIDVGVDLDEVYVVVEREINGSTVRLLERMEKDLRTDACVYDNNVSGSPTTITGLSHLEGETVRVYTDGFLRADAVVSSGQITVEDAIESSYEVGLKFPDVSTDGDGYEVYIETLSPEPELRDGTAVGRKKRIVEVILRVLNTGEIVCNGERMILRQFGSDLLDEAAPDFSGDYELGPFLGWDDEGKIKIGDDIGAKMHVSGIAYKLGV